MVAVPVGIALAAGIVLVIPACGEQLGVSATIQETTTSVGESPMPVRLAVTQADRTDVAEAAASNNAFSLDLFKALRSGTDNLVCSPYSVSLALAMTMAGATGQTQDEMKQTLQMSLPRYRLDRALNALDQDLTGRGSFQCANSIWGQTGTLLKQPFLELLAQYYGAPLRQVDLNKDYAGACEVVNDWVSRETNGRITDLLSPDDPPPTPRLMVLANAVHFKANWADKFWPQATREQPFFLLDGKATVTVPMMKQLNRPLKYPG